MSCSFMFSKTEFAIISNLRFNSRTNFMLSWVEHEKCFITSGPVHRIIGHCRRYGRTSDCPDVHSDPNLCITSPGRPTDIGLQLARPAILLAGKGRMLLFLLFLHFRSCSSFFHVTSSTISSIYFLLCTKRHKMTHKSWRVVKPKHNHSIVYDKLKGHFSLWLSSNLQKPNNPSEMSKCNINLRVI